MAHYTVHVPESEMAMGMDSPLTALEAYYKVQELRDIGFKLVTLINVNTGEQVTDVAGLVQDSPNA
jgi:hypothetical protein